MPTKDSQIAQEAARKLAQKLLDAGDCPRDLNCLANIEAELHRALDPLLERMEQQESLLACYRLCKRPTEKLFDEMDQTRKKLKEAGWLK